MYNRRFTPLTPRRKARRRGTARLFVLGAAFAASTATGGPLATRLHAASGVTREAQSRGAATGQSADALPIAFAIQPGPLASVLPAFEQMTRTRVVLSEPAIGTIQSPGAVGTMTRVQALEMLLMGTGVGYRFTAGDVVRLDVRGAGEFVAVTGERPGLS